jgi:hypothetical protein
VTSPAPPNSVLFNTAITGVAPQVDVIVTKQATLSSLTLPFSRMISDESRAGLGAWEGVDAVKNPATGVRWALFYCDFSEVGTVPIDVRLRLDAGSTLIDGVFVKTLTSGDAMIVLSREKLYMSVDRQRSKWIPLSALTTTTDYLVIKTIDKVRELLVTESSAVDTFPPLTVLTYQPKTLITSTATLAGDGDAAALDNTIIIGPDA